MSTNNDLIPIKLRELFSLQKELGISLSNITFPNVSMESDKYIVVRETVGNSVQALILDIDNPNEVNRRPLIADSALMNPSKKILALRYDKTLQLLDLEQKAQIKKHTATDNVVFWKWTNEKTVGFVTEESVYHWKVEGNSEPIKMFQRDSVLTSKYIVDCRADHQGKFIFIVGIIPKDEQIDGSIQLYNTETKQSQLFDGHAACFTQFKKETNSQPNNLFCYALRTKNGNGELHILEMLSSQNGNRQNEQKTIKFQYSTDATNDFPVLIQPSSKSGILYLFTKLGYAHLFDIETGICIYTVRISDKTIFVSTEYKQNDGVLCIDGSGKVISVGLDKSTIIPFVTQHLQNSDLAFKLALRFNLPGIEEPQQSQEAQSVQQINQAITFNGANSNGPSPIAPMFELVPKKALIFKEKSGHIGSVSLTIKNCKLHATSIYFKVKSTSSLFYSVCPEKGIIKPRGRVKLIIQANDDSLDKIDEIIAKKHKFLIMSAIVSNLTVQADEFWKDKKQGSEGVYSTKLKAKVQKEYQQNLAQSNDTMDSKKSSPIPESLETIQENKLEQNQKMETPSLENLPKPSLLEKKKASPSPARLETISENELEQNQSLENLQKQGLELTETQLMKSPQNHEELLEQNLRMASSSWSLESYPENEQSQQEEALFIPEKVQDFEFVSLAPKASSQISEGFQSQTLMDNNYSNSNVNHLYAQYSVELIGSLLDKMSKKESVQFRKELNSVLEKYQAQHI